MVQPCVFHFSDVTELGEVSGHGLGIRGSVPHRSRIFLFAIRSKALATEQEKLADSGDELFNLASSPACWQI